MSDGRRSAQETAELAARAMWSGDLAAQALGIEIVECGPGMATLKMIVRDDMVNGHDTAHGGFIFALADTAFAYACNSHGHKTLAAHCSITFTRSGRRGDSLIARAREVTRAGRSGVYDVSVSVAEEIIAEFRGLSRTVGGSFIEADQLAPATIEHKEKPRLGGK